jgi:hypothetical protein
VVFSRTLKRNLDPYFRAVYIMQLIAVIAMFAGMFLIWWQGVDSLNAFDLYDRSTAELRDRSPHVLGQPLVVLWFLWPCVVICGLRGFTGVLVTPVAFRTLALLAWFVSLLALGHFYINFGDDLAPASPLKDGQIHAGFWLTASSTVILGLLLVVETLIRVREEDPFLPQQGPTAPVDDAERLWRGEYQTCPYCGMLNEPAAKACYNCHNLLFNFEED